MLKKRNASIKRISIVIFLSIVLLISIELQSSNTVRANPMYTQIPPKVGVTGASIHASISSSSGEFWANVDAEYHMHTIYGFGDSYVARNSGMGLVTDPSPYVTVTVTQNTLDAHYPIPINITDLSVKINNQEIKWQIDKKGFFHIFDANLAEVNWTVSPVPSDFLVTVHYEQPIPKTSSSYGYLGDYALIIPVYGRYGCSSISYPLYSWFEYLPEKFNIQVEPFSNKIQAYSIHTNGTLTPLNYTNSNSNELLISQENEDFPFIHGAVIVFSPNTTGISPSPTLLVISATVTLLVIIGLGLLVYFKKRKGKP